MATRYQFITSFRVSSDRHAVWSVLDDPKSCTDWWRWLRNVEILDRGDGDGLGAVVRNTVGTPLGYRLTYNGITRRRVKPELFEFDATGDLVGIGQFRLHTDHDGGTEVLFNWLVETPAWWMNLTAPVARPVFSWNHDRLMTDFASGISLAARGEMTGLQNRTLRSEEPGFYTLPEA